MMKTKLLWLTCLAVALSGPALAHPGDGGGGDHGGSNQSSGNSSQNGSGGDHGNQSGASSSQNGSGDNHGGQSTTSGSQNGSNDDHGGQSTTTSGSQSGKGDDHGGQSGTNGSQSGKGDDNGANAPQAVQRTEVRLALTPQGAGVQGNVDIRAQGNEQRLKVQIDVTDPTVKDGSVFTVFANGQMLGTITIHMQEGELELDLQNGMALTSQGLMASDITSIQVVGPDLKAVVLQAVFASLSSGPVTTPVPPAVGGVVRKEAALKGTVDPSLGAVNAEAELRVQGAQQLLKVEVDAVGAPDGTVMTVSATVMGMTVPIGTVTFRLNEAEFKLDNTSILPMGITSLSDITNITVSAGSLFNLQGAVK